MVYTLAMQLKESLTELLVAKAAAKELEEQAEQMRIQEVRFTRRSLLRRIYLLLCICI